MPLNESMNLYEIGGRKNDVNVVRVSSERRLADVPTNDSDVPSLLDGSKDGMKCKSIFRLRGDSMTWRCFLRVRPSHSTPRKIIIIFING